MSTPAGSGGSTQFPAGTTITAWGGTSADPFYAYARQGGFILQAPPREGPPQPSYTPNDDWEVKKSTYPHGLMRNGYTIYAKRSFAKDEIIVKDNAGTIPWDNLNQVWLDIPQNATVDQVLTACDTHQQRRFQHGNARFKVSAAHITPPVNSTRYKASIVAAKRVAAGEELVDVREDCEHIVARWLLSGYYNATTRANLVRAMKQRQQVNPRYHYAVLHTFEARTWDDLE